MELAILTGLTKKEIPYEGQIIRVADEYDAIVSKRQYKSHVGISQALQFLIDESYPEGDTSNRKSSKLGKVNPIILKALIKVVKDDINYEISCTQNYLSSLKENIKRLEKVDQYKCQMEKSKKEKDCNYYLEGMKLYLQPSETIENFPKVLEEYKKALQARKQIIENLYEEIKKIKKLKF